MPRLLGGRELEEGGSVARLSLRVHRCVVIKRDSLHSGSALSGPKRAWGRLLDAAACRNACASAPTSSSRRLHHRIHLSLHLATPCTQARRRMCTWSACGAGRSACSSEMRTTVRRRGTCGAAGCAGRRRPRVSMKACLHDEPAAPPAPSAGARCWPLVPPGSTAPPVLHPPTDRARVPLLRLPRPLLRASPQAQGQRGRRRRRGAAGRRRRGLHPAAGLQPCGWVGGWVGGRATAPCSSAVGQGVAMHGHDTIRSSSGGNPDSVCRL